MLQLFSVAYVMIMVFFTDISLSVCVRVCARMRVLACVRACVCVCVGGGQDLSGPCTVTCKI
jgi:hypothetical protein